MNLKEFKEYMEALMNSYINIKDDHDRKDLIELLRHLIIYIDEE